MGPAYICKTYLGNRRLGEVIARLSSPQIKKVLKEGGLKTKVSAGYSSQRKRRDTWDRRISSAVIGGNDDAASELLQQWLLNHERPMLIEYLDILGVRHQAGETDQSFFFTNPPDACREAASQLLEKRDPALVATYLVYVAFQQRSNVFDEWGALDIVAKEVALSDAAQDEKPPAE